MDKEKAIQAIDRGVVFRYEEGQDIYLVWAMTPNYLHIEHISWGTTKSLRNFPRAVGYEEMARIAPFADWQVDD